MSATSILVHGGAGPLGEHRDERMAGCLAAARRGHAILARGGSALDAVEAAVVALEDDPLFNAGTGSCLNAEGNVEMDASIMNGEELSAGAVAVVSTIKNPIRLARAVMEQTPHVLLAAEGAARFAREIGVPFCDPRSLVTEHARRQLAVELAKARTLTNAQATKTRQTGGGTVGAVARDAHGHVAAATSTGGMTGKRPGRIGDAPLIGCGTYADDLAGAASSTGHGEMIIKVVLAKTACELLRAGRAPSDGAQAAINDLRRVQGTAGIILVDRNGRLGFGFNTESLARAWVDSDGMEGAALGP
jgi:beta-aspartyl-peptidase (threonine type)